MHLILGAHQSAAGGYCNAIRNIAEKGGTCLQLFSSSPRGWRDRNLSAEDKKAFIKLKKELSINPIYFHACYLINLASDGENGRKSVLSLVHELNLAHEIDVCGSVIHTGSFKNGKIEKPIRDEHGFNTLISNIKTVLAETPRKALLILENAGTRKIGKSIEDLSSILESVNDPRLKVCLDTCHLHAAGYDLRSQEAFDTFIARFDMMIGIKYLEVVHLNDSCDPFGSLRDRHDNIGEGAVGMDVFRHFLTNNKTARIPFIIETPGFDGKGPDKRNLDILKNSI